MINKLIFYLRVYLVQIIKLNGSGKLEISRSTIVLKGEMVQLLCVVGIMEPCALEKSLLKK